MLVLIFPALNACFGQGGLFINSGASVVCSGTPVIVVDNGKFSNSGTFTAASSTIKMTGTATAANTSITGSSTSSFFKLEIAKTTNDVQLLKGINVSSELKLSGKNLDLGSQIATLTGTSPTLSGENQNSRLITTSTGTVTHTRSLNAPSSLNVANIGAQITTTANLGSTKIDRGHKSQTVSAGITSINRFYKIAPTNNSNLNATLRLFYFDAELNGAAESTLEIWRSTNNGTSWSKVTTGAITRNSTENWVQRTGFSTLTDMYTLAKPTAFASDDNCENYLNNEQNIAEMLPTAVASINIYPNPTGGLFRVQIESPKESVAHLCILSLDGMLLRKEEIALVVGQNSFAQDISNLPPGTYLVQCEGLEIPALRLVKG